MKLLLDGALATPEGTHTSHRLSVKPATLFSIYCTEGFK